MIGSIRGKVLSITGLSVLIELNNGLGYEVEVTAKSLQNIAIDQECFFYIHNIIREDADLLYGFDSREARLLFRELIKINSVGPKVAMALLSSFDLASFIACINGGHVNSLMAAPGVGKKTAERILVEMKDRLNKLKLQEMLISNGSTPAKDSSREAELPTISSALFFDDAIAGLIALGYKESVAMSTAKSVYQDGMDAQTIIVKSLAVLSKR